MKNADEANQQVAFLRTAGTVKLSSIRAERAAFLQAQKCHFKGTTDITGFLAMLLLSNCTLKCPKTQC